MAFDLLDFSDFEKRSLVTFYNAIPEKVREKSISLPRITRNGIDPAVLSAKTLGELLGAITRGADVLVNLPKRTWEYGTFSTAMTYQSILLQLLLGADFKECIHEPSTRKALSFFILFTTKIAFNAGAIRDKIDSPSREEDCIKLMQYVMKMIKNLEYTFFEELQTEPELKALHTHLLQAFLQAQRHLQGGSVQFNGEQMAWHVEQKNTKAQLKGSGFNGVVLYSPTAEWAEQCDPKALEALFSLIKEFEEGESVRKQVLFYLGIETGHALTLDIARHPETGTIQIICVDSAPTWQQWLLLKQIVAFAQAEKISLEILACQADLQKDGFSCPIYAFYFATLLARTSFTAIQAQQQHHQAIPPFYTPMPEINPFSYDAIGGVQWFNVLALGERAVLMNQSYTEMRTQLQTLYPTNDKRWIDGRIQAFQRKYNLSGEVKFIQKQGDKLTQRYRKQPVDITAEGLLLKLKGEREESTPTPEVALRRLAAGFGTQDELEFALSAFKNLNLNDASSDGSTALHWAFKKHLVGRAMLLCEAGADPLVPNKMEPPQSPKDLCQAGGHHQSPYFKARLFSG